MQVGNGELTSAPDFIENIRLEITLLAPRVRKRPVNLLTIQDATGLCSNTEFTALMYIFGKNFNLSHSHSKLLTFESTPFHLTEHRLALLTGLGFNRVSILLSPEMDTFDTPLPLDLEEKIRDYGFPRPAIKLYYGDDNSKIAWQQLMNYLLIIRPEKILAQRLRDVPPAANLLPSSTEHKAGTGHEMEQFLMVYTTLRKKGYQVIGNDCFVSKSHALAKAQAAGKLWRTVNGYNASNVSDSLNLGPGAQSQLGAFYYRNLENISLYAAAIREHRSPLWRGLALDNRGLACKRVVDELSCFHKIRFSPAMYLHHVDLKEIFDRLDTRFADHTDYPFWATGDDGLILTDSGVLYLRMICDAVCGELTTGLKNGNGT